MPNWYELSRFHLHLQRPYSVQDNPPPLEGLDRDSLREVLTRLRPDFVTYTAKSLAGWVPYETTYSNRHPLLHGPEDVLSVYRTITRELGIRFVLGVASLVDQHAVDWRPEWKRQASGVGDYPQPLICPNTAYVEERFLPLLDEMLEKFSPDGIWLDGEAWTVSPCYCSSCTMDFELLHGRSAPYDRRNDFWPDWLKFHRDSYRRYLERVLRYLHDRSPELVVGMNGAFGLSHPEEVTSGLDRLTRDLPPLGALEAGWLEAAMLDPRGVPFDLVSSATSSSRPWPVGNKPARPAFPKSSDALRQEAAVVLAGGGRWGLWADVPPNDALPLSLLNKLAPVVESVRSNPGFASESYGYAAILHSAPTHQKTGNGLYDAGPCLDRIRGASRLLRELHHPADIVCESELLRHLDRYQLVVVPEQIELTDECLQALAGWCERGRALVVSGRAAARVDLALQVFGMESVVGVAWTGQRDASACFDVDGVPIRLDSPTCLVRATTAEVIQPLRQDTLDGEYRDREYPLATVNRRGEGRVLYLAPDFFAGYYRNPYSGLRDWFASLLDRVITVPPLLTTAPAHVGITLRRTDLTMQVHCVELTSIPSGPFPEQVPITAPFTMTLQLLEPPVSVALEPGDGDLEWHWENGALTVCLPEFRVHAMVEIRFPEVGPDPVSDPAEDTSPGIPSADATFFGESDPERDSDSGPDLSATEPVEPA